MVPKVKAKRDAGECQRAIEATLAPCEHGPTVRHTQQGARVGTLQQKMVLRRRADRSPVAAADEIGARGLGRPTFDALYIEETETQVVNELPDPTYDEVLVSPSLVKKDGTQATLADFPDGFSFGNGVTTGSTVRLKDGTEYILSWVVIPPAQGPAVRARFADLRAMMET